MKEFPYSQKVRNISGSSTIAISALASTLKAQGKDILDFSAGEPDFDTPEIIKQSAIEAIRSGFSKYTAVAGIKELRVAIAEKLMRENSIDYDFDEIVVSNGAKQALFNIFQALIQEGDEVIVPCPCWVTYPELVTYSGGKNIFVSTREEDSFKITPDLLKSSITSKTKALIITTPSNPTGSVYTRDELEALAEVLRKSDIWVISDEMYEKLLYRGSFASVASINSDMLSRTITVNGISKSVAMTGWRMGYLASKDRNLVKLIENLQSQCTSNINSITQKAAIAALDGSADKDIERMRLAFMQRCVEGVRLINNIPSLSVVQPDGAFYFFINIQKTSYGKDSREFAKRLLEQEGVAVVPGIAFKMEGYIRFSFACSLEQVKEGIRRIERFLS